MAKKYPKSEAIQNSNTVPDQAYVTWEDSNLEDKRSALTEASKGLDEFNIIERSKANNTRYRIDFSNIDGPTSGRPGLTRSDYDYFRPDEAVPTEIKQIIRRADDVYQRVGLVKNVRFNGGLCCSRHKTSS